MPYENAPETIAPGEEEKPPEEMGLGDKVLHGAAMFGNEATMGVVPALASLNPEAKQKILRYLREGEEELGPGLSTGIKIAGAFATPLPGLGAIKGATTLGKIGASAARGAIAGGVGAGLSNVAQQSPGGIDVGDALKSAGIGTLGGGVIGGALGAVGTGASKYLKSRAEQSIFSAGGGTEGSIKKLGQYEPMSNVRRSLTKENKVAQTALKEGWIGKVGQGTQDSVDKAAKSGDQASRTIESIMAKHGDGDIIKLKPQPLIDTVIEGVTKRLSGKKGTPPNSEQQAGIESLKRELEHLFEYDSKTGEHVGGIINARKLQEVKSSIGNMVYGMSKSKVLTDSNRPQIFAIGKSILSDVEDKMISALDPVAGKEFVAAKTLMHHARLWEGMGIRATRGEKGLAEHLMGRGMRSIPDSYVVGAVTKNLPFIPSNPLVNQALANLIGRGRVANLMVAGGKLPDYLNKSWLRKGGAFAPATSQRVGSMVGKIAGSQ